jgi:predicted  nucleic acid-binding Zn-ribbon protein|tara:strand:- start:329 stop:508 length:180 start_codon:yes stop_codon:yes gene_type:complete
MANIVEMAKAHLLNVQQQINDLENQKARIDEDIKALSDYLQQGAAELEADENDSTEEVE